MFKLLNFFVSILHCALGLLLVPLIALGGAAFGLGGCWLLWSALLPFWPGLLNTSWVLVWVVLPINVAVISASSIFPVVLFCKTDEFRKHGALLCALFVRSTATLKKPMSLAALGWATGLILLALGAGYGWFLDK